MYNNIIRSYFAHDKCIVCTVYLLNMSVRHFIIDLKGCVVFPKNGFARQVPLVKFFAVETLSSSIGY